jgi:hypothetical protein
MSRFESFWGSRLQGAPSGLNEARRSLVSLTPRRVALVSADSLRWRNEAAVASAARAGLDAAAKASLAGRLFVVDYATLVDDLGSLMEAMKERAIWPPFDVTPIFMPGCARDVCPLFVITRETENLFGLTTAIPMKHRETLFWAVPGFHSKHLATAIATALLAVIDIRDLKPIGPPR